MKIAFNPSTVAALTSPPDNKDITFDLRGRNIFARGVKFYGTDTNTWRDIKVNNVSIGSHTLDLRNGSNTTLTNTNGVVTINSTWRPVVDNLTSNSTTSSLSANQGRVLAGLINGKSDSDHNHDGRYIRKSGDTMLGALNFANGTWNLVGYDSYMGDCNVGGHFGIKAANTTYPGIAFFNKTGNHLGNLTAYSGNIKYGAYSLQFLDNGNTSVSVSTWTNPFSAYNSNAVADGQAICVWGQASQLSNLSTDTGNMSLWLKRVNAKVATLNMVLDGEYYANGNQRLAHVSEIPTSLKNPHALTISLNGTSQGPYDGSAAKNINITPGSIGAAVSNHSHDYLVVNTADDKSFNSAYHNFQVLYAGGSNGITGKPANVDAFGLFRFRAASGWSGQMLLANGGSLYIRSSEDAKMTNTLAWKTILDSSNYSGILDSRYYTESEVNSLLSKKLDRVNLSVGSWNPRGYNLAADYFYNGGDLSISESKGQIHVSINGYFWQNEGQYRVLDTSDVAGLKGDLTVHQYLSNTDTTWWPLIWGGSSHANTSDSTGAVYKSHDKLSWQTSSQTLYATHLRTTNLDTQTAIFHPDNDSTLKIYSGRTQDGISDGHIGLQTSIDNTDGQTHVYPTQYGSRCVLALQPRGGSVYIGNMPNGGNGRKLNVNGDIGLFNTGSIRDLAIGGGIYWNPNVESATDGSDAASITLVKSGVAGGTTLVLSQMNDANDTIQFKTNTAAKLYHNSYPILTTQNTYVSNHKGYINGTEITQVNNADTVDGWHKDNIQWTGYITSGDTLASYWFKMYDITVTRYQYNDITITFLVSEGFTSHFSIFYLRIRQNEAIDSGNYDLNISLYELVGNLRDKVVAYYNNSTGNVQLWGNTGGRWGTMNYTILKKTTRTNTDSSSLGTLTAQSFSSVQTPPSTGYSKVTMSRVGSVSYSDSTGSVHWNNITNKPSTFNPAAHTHTVFKNNLMIKGTNGISDSASIHLGIGDSDTGFKWISDGVCQIYADNVAIGQWTSGGMNWFKNPTVNGNKVWNAGNDGSGSGLDADTVDGEHANSFVRAGHFESANLNSLDTYSFIKSVNSNVASASPNGNTGWYNVIQAVHRNGANDGPNYIGQIALGMTTNLSAMFYRTKYNGSWYAWNEVVTTNTGLLRYSRNNVNISSPNCSPIPPSLLEWTVGYPRLYDPEFNEGDNNVWVYNNAGNGVVTVTRVHDTNVGNSSSYVMKVVSAAGATPNYGGWHVQTQTELGKVYTCLFRASIPSGVEIEWNSNPIGTGGQMSWLTNNMGTGKWTWYAVQVYCGSGGSTTFFFSAKSPCTWYLSYVNVIENNRASYAGLRSVYSDYLKANASIVFGRNELQYFNQYTGVTAGATNNANPKPDWYHILRMNHANNSGYFVDLAIPFFDNKIQFRRITNGSDNGWRRVITEEPNHDVILREASTDGNVGIGINNPAYKLDVNGQMRAEGFHHWTVNSDNYILLAGGGYKSFGGDYSNPIFLGYLNLDHGNDGTISSSFSCLGYSVPFTYTRGGNYCRIYIHDTTHQVFYIKAATASVNYSGGGMDTWTGVHRGSGAWWLHCYAESTNEVRVKGFCQNNNNNDSWWGGNPLWSGNDGANQITVCIFGYVKFR